MEKILFANTLKQISAIDLSKYILKYFSEKNTTINHLKLQKLVYYIDAWHYVLLEKPLIMEDFEAWMHGPVVRALWDYYKNESILSNALILKDEYQLLFVTQEQLEVINDVLDEYGDKTSYYLECLTHEEKPWLMARVGYAASDYCSEVISKEIMKQYYSEKLYG